MTTDDAVDGTNASSGADRMIAEAGTSIVKYRIADSAKQSLSGEEEIKTHALMLTVLELMQVYRASLLRVCQIEPGAKQRGRDSGTA